MKLISITFLSILFLSCSVGKNLESSTKTQDYPSPSSDWIVGNCPCTEISICLMEGKDPPNWFNLEGEAILKLSSKVDYSSGCQFCNPKPATVSSTKLF